MNHFFAQDANAMPLKWRSASSRHPVKRLCASLRALFICTVFISSASFGVSAQTVSLNEDDLLLLDFVAERQILAHSVTAYSLGKTAVVSLAEAGAALEFPILVDLPAGTARGAFIRPERRFELNIKDGFVEIEGVRSAITPNDAFVYKDGIFVTVEAFSRWFPVDLRLKAATLTIEVEPRERLPFQERQARRQSAQQTYGIGPATLPFIDSPYKLLGPHATDIGLGYSIRRPDGTGKPVTGLTYSALVSGDMAFMDSRIYLSGSDKEALSQARFSLSRNYVGMPLGLRYVEVGDIVPAIVPGLSYSGVEQGMLFQGGGSAIGRDDMIGSDIFNLSGDALEGWDVELFQNGMRVGFQTVGANGRYNFTNLEPFAGENKFELMFYGPAGERRTETMTRYSGLTPDLPGSVRYQYSVSRKGEQIYQPKISADSGMSDLGSARIAASLEMRVLPKLAVRGSWNNLMIDGRRLNYSSLGASAGWRDLSFGVGVTRDPLSGERWDGSIGLPAQKKLGGFDARFSHTQYAQTVLIDDPEELDKYELQLRSRTGISLSGPIGVTKSQFSLFHNREPERSSNQFLVGVTARTGRINYGNTINYYQFSRDASNVRAPDRLDGNLFFNSQLHPLSLRGGMSYTLKPETEVAQYFLDSNLTIAKDMSVNFGLSYSPLRDVTRYSSGLNWQLPQVTLSPRINYDSNGEYSGFVYATFSLAPRPDRSGVLVSGRSLATSGTVAARVFLDNDGSQTVSAGDEPLPNVSVRALQAYRTAKTDAKGVAYLTDISGQRPTDVVLEAQTLPSPQMISTHAGNSVRPRPTVIKVIDFPVIPTGEIDGYVYRMQMGKRVPLPGAMVELRKPDGKVAAFKISSQDGLFVFEDIHYGTYSLGLAGRSGTNAEPVQLVLKRGQSEILNVEIVVPEVLAANTEAKQSPQPPQPPQPQAAIITLPTLPVAPPVAPPKPESGAIKPLEKPAVPLATDSRLVQIAAFADIEGARAYRLKLQAMDVLKDARIDIVSVDLGRHGLFHRVVANPGSTTADALCKALKTQGIECFTIAP